MSQQVRREFLKRISTLSLALGGGLQAAQNASPSGSMIGVPFTTRKNTRMGLIGAGGRGGGMVRNYLAVDNLTVTAVCDVNKDAALRAQATVERAGQNPPAIFANGDHDFENLVKRDDVDFVYIATPWSWHAPMAIAAMEAGKHAIVEVPAAVTTEECWKLVDVSERTRRHCIIAENCCYGYTELMVLNMIKDGLFGDLLHGEAAYIHDLRSLLFSGKGEGLWRRLPNTLRDANTYPTHGLGPVANYMGINRGDRFDYLVSMSSPEAGLSAWRAAKIPKGAPEWKEKYIAGDMNTSLIKTVKGLTIMLQHDTVNPRPYDRINLISGTKAVFRDYPPRLYVDGVGKEEFTGLDAYKAKYEHPLWQKNGEMARKLGGHGGMDFLMVHQLVTAMQEGLVPPMDVYDAAAWSVPYPLSEESVKLGSAPVKFPDFTRGKWKVKRGWLA